MKEQRQNQFHYIERGIFDREPQQYLCRGDMYLEKSGIQTFRGDVNRAIVARNKEREQHRKERVRSKSKELSR